MKLILSMKRKLVIFLAFFSFIFIYKGIKMQNSTSSLREDISNFSISDTLNIKKILLENRNLDKIKLHRQINEKKWILNDSFDADKYSIDLILKTIKEMRVKQPISNAAIHNVIKRMSIQNTKVELFDKKGKIKTIYIGGETPDQLGTYMMIEGAKKPYIVHIPGFNGYLSSRFSCKKQTWRSKNIFPKNINKAYYKFDSNQEVEINIQNVELLEKIYCEKYIDNIINIDEIKMRQPFISFKTISEQKKEQIFYCIRKKPVNKEKYANDKFDKERFYLLNNEELILVQYSQFEDLILSEKIIEEFLPKKNNI